MPWVILIAIIFVVLFVMILVPKATKGYTGKDNLTDVAWAKGFKRIYFVASTLWIGGFTIALMADPPTDPDVSKIPMIIFVISPIPVYFFIKWIFSGFKQVKKKKK
jgi:hypothetical protein|tara:strand:- start:90 stop:407 length:318 start_codon:yes stop_codon:yes gene_type:complete